jgi:hypothetical protein
MPSRSNREERETPPVYGRRRETTVGQDVKDILGGIGRTIGGLTGGAADKLRNRGRQIDKEVEDRS